MKLNYKKTVFVGFIFFLICAFWQAYDTIIPKILTDKFGMSQTWSGAVMALDNVLALVLLPLFGAVSDRCKSRHGRRTPFIVVGTVISAALLILLSVSDGMQLKKLEAVTPDNPSALATLYDSDLTVTTPSGKTVSICDEFSKAEFTSVKTDGTITIGGSAVGAGIKGNETNYYTDYVVPARQAYASSVTEKSPSTLIFFIVTLLLILLSMAVFRSPAVALMPDVTIKPLRSKANSVINLMGALGGALILVLGQYVFKTGKAENALMSYFAFFLTIALIMIAGLLVFLKTVNEPKLVSEMKEEEKKYGIEDTEDEYVDKRKLSRPERRSLLLLMASVALWFFGYNAVTSKYSVYAGAVLNLDYNMPLLIATASAIISYIPVGIVASKIGRKKTIIAGIIILGTSFFAASFMRAGVSVLVMYILFGLAGVGWATINVNSFPMVVELAKGGDEGKYTGFYYTASMAAQTLTPILSGWLMDKLGMRILFPYGAVFVFLAIITMIFVLHGDSRPTPAKSKLEAFDVDI